MAQNRDPRRYASERYGGSGTRAVPKFTKEALR
jgi:hypothetical protein